MTPNRILQINAVATAGCAIGMLATRGILPGLFGMETPTLFDALAVGLLAYAGLLAASAQRPQVSRATLLAFTLGDALWVVGSALVLLIYWGQLAPVARVLVIAIAGIVEVFATLQWRAAGRVRDDSGRHRMTVRPA